MKKNLENNDANHHRNHCEKEKNNVAIHFLGVGNENDKRCEIRLEFFFQTFIYRRMETRLKKIRIHRSCFFVMAIVFRIIPIY